MKKYLKLFLKIFLWLVVFITLFLLWFFYTFFYNKHYLVVLQNAGEARPGGGFYGSVALLDFDGFSPSVKVEIPSFCEKEKNVVTCMHYLNEDKKDDMMFYIR